MAQVGALIDFTPVTRIASADVDQNFSDLRTGVNSAVFTDESTNIEDDIQLRFGTTTRFWWVYEAANGRLVLKTTDSDGAGTDADVLRIANGGLVVAFQGAVSATAFTGNASTATALATARTINGTSFDGTANITVTAAAGTLTGTTLAATVVTSSLTTVGTIGSGAWQGTAVGVAYGGTGLTAAGSSGNYLRSNGSAWASSAIQAADLPSHSHAASAVTSGTFADARIAQSNVTQYQAALSIGATQLTGTVASARLSGSYTGITAVGTLASLAVSGAVTAGSLNLGSDEITDMFAASASSVAFSTTGDNYQATGIALSGVAVGDMVMVKRATGVSGSGFSATTTIFEARVTGADTISVTAWPDATWSAVVLDLEFFVVRF